jgi:hypothetical protein
MTYLVVGHNPMVAGRATSGMRQRISLPCQAAQGSRMGRSGGEMSDYQSAATSRHSFMYIVCRRLNRLRQGRVALRRCRGALRVCDFQYDRGKEAQYTQNVQEPACDTSLIENSTDAGNAGKGKSEKEKADLPVTNASQPYRGQRE